MKLEFLPLDKLFVDKTNMRAGKKAPDVSDILPTIRKRGVLQPLLVRPADDDRFGIVAGSRRFRAARRQWLKNTASRTRKTPAVPRLLRE